MSKAQQINLKKQQSQQPQHIKRNHNGAAKTTVAATVSRKSSLTKPTTKTTTNTRTNANSLESTSSAEDALAGVDVVSDALYCAQEVSVIKSVKSQQNTPRPAPRGNPTVAPPPTPKPRSVLPSSSNNMISSSPLLCTTAAEATKAEPSAIIAVSNNAIDSLILEDNLEPQTTPRSKQRLIKVDFSLLQDDDTFFNESSLASTSACSKMGVCSQPKMPPYPIGGYMVSNVAGLSGNSNNQASTAHKTLNSSISTAPQASSTLTNRVLRRTTYDLATQCESRRASLRRHTIVGCQSNFEETNSMPTSRPDSRQSDVNANGVAPNKPHSFATQKFKGRGSVNAASSVGPWNKSFLDEKTWQERGDDRLSLTLEEIVHIRSVMTKAELEGLPVGVRVKEDVEKRKVCFLCLRTRFSIFGPWGIVCKLCQRTVCSKCYTKMRIPTEHFRNVPLVLISPSVLASPAGSSTPSPSHQAHYAHSSSTGNILDENFPKSLIERLLRSESERKARNSVGSAPSSPKHQRSNISTPASNAAATAQANAAMTSSYTAAYVNGNQIKPTTQVSLMSRSMEGPRSLPVNSPGRTHSNSSTLDRKSKFARAFTLSASGTHLSQDQKENVRGELVSVCNDCSGLVLEITRSSKQTRSSARNRALQNLTLDLSPVYK